MNNKVYIIKPYNKYLLPQLGETVLYKFNLYDTQYCISEVILQWGKPLVARLIEQQDDYGYYLYNTYQQAMNYVKILKQIER